MKPTIITTAFIKEFASEVASSRKCVERISETLYEYKPHPTSMKMQYLTLLVAEIPLWIQIMIDQGEIDFATYKHVSPKSTAEMVAHMDHNVAAARRALESLTDDDLSREFALKNGGQLIMKQPLADSIPSTINHWVHHRGQLSVYMRLNEIAVPSIYGPSADDKGN